MATVAHPFGDFQKLTSSLLRSREHWRLCCLARVEVFAGIWVIIKMANTHSGWCYSSKISKLSLAQESVRKEEMPFSYLLSSHSSTQSPSSSNFLSIPLSQNHREQLLTLPWKESWRLQTGVNDVWPQEVTKFFQVTNCLYRLKGISWGKGMDVWTYKALSGNHEWFSMIRKKNVGIRARVVLLRPLI